MNDNSNEFAVLLEQTRTGCPKAARQLHDRYAVDVRRVVRARLMRKLRREFDSTDFTQAVWLSFFALPLEDWRFATPEELVAFLSGMACQKVRNATRRRETTAGQMDDLQLSLDEMVDIDGDPPGPEHTPSKALQADETWEQLTRNLTEGQRRMLEMARDGLSLREIADRVGSTPMTVRRLIQALRVRLGEI